MNLEDRLLAKAKAGVSNENLLTPELLSAALLEASEIIEDKKVSDTVRLDIANFRLMLMVKKNLVDDTEVDLYSKALKIVKDAPALDGDKEIANPDRKVMVGQRVSRW